jgi:hypothetical protein
MEGVIMPRYVVSSDSSVSLKPAARKLRGSTSNEELARKREDAIFSARLKFDEWASAMDGLFRRRGFADLVTPTDGDDEGIFEPDEFALVPTRDLENYRGSFVEAKERLEHMEEQPLTAIAAREAEGE